MRGRLVLAVAAALVVAPPARAGGPGLILGATEDAVRSPSLVQAKAQMDLASLAGFRAVRITEIWTPGDTAVSKTDTTILRNVAAAAKLDGMQVLTTVMSFGSATTPLTTQDQSDFASFAASVVTTVPSLDRIIVGNEPNLNRYWLPQFNPDGTDAAAPAYETLLAKTYDALKAANPKVEVLGGAVSPRGSDNPSLTRQTHSPTGFIRDLGTAYRASGRTTPIMDAFAFHPYEDDSSVAPLLGLHPNSTTIAIGDYAKLVALLGTAFDGTAQAGSKLPIVYDEFGVESQIPAAKQDAYTGTEPSTTKPVTEQIAGRLLPPGDPARVLPADGRGALPLPLGGREGARGVAVRPLLRGRHAEDEPRRGARVDGPVAARRRRTLPRDAARGPKPAVVQHGATLTLELRSRLLVRRAALPAPREAARDDARNRRRRPRDRTEAPRPDCESLVPAPPQRGRPRQPGQGGTEARPRPPRLAFGTWKASTSRTRSTASTRRGGACRSRSARPRRMRSPTSSRTSPTGSSTSARTRPRASGPEADFFLWKIVERYELLGELGAALNGTPLAGWLETPYSYLGTSKASQYTKATRPRKITPHGLPYLVVYPFVKVRPWYFLPEEDRQRAMDEHMVIGREEFPGIRNHTTYSFGIDDQEFMTAFECDEPADFMHLMLRLRESEASRYTERDTPIFVGQHVTIREALAALDGAASRVEL